MFYRFNKSLSFAAFFATLSMLSATPFSALIEEDVDIFISMRSLAESRSSWAGHPFAAVLEDPGLQAFFEPLTQAAEAFEKGAEAESATEVLENEFGLSWDELFELFPGQTAVAFHNLPELLLQQTERPDFVILAEYAGQPDQLKALMQVQFERNAESQKALNPLIEHSLIEASFMGETLYLDETFDGESTYIEDGYALVDGVFILATPEARLRTAVEAVKEGPDAPLAEKAAYLRSREGRGRGDLELYVNLEAIVPPLNAALIEKAMAGGMAMFGISAQSLDAALSLKSCQAVFFDLDLIEEGLRSHSGLLYREKAGLLTLLTYTDAPLPEARYVPESVFSASISNFHVGRMLAQLETLLTTASPMMHTLIDAQLQTIRTNIGVDLRYALLENFGGDIATFSTLPGDTRGEGAMLETEQIFVLGLKDAEALSASFEALKDMLPGMREQIETREFAGETIHTIRAGGPPQDSAAAANTVSYVITRSHFILCVGRVSGLQEVLSALELGADGFWQTARAEAWLDRIARPAAVSRSYVDLEKLMLPIFQSIVQTSRMGSGSTALTMERIPKDLSMPFDLISETNEADDGIFSRTLILKREVSQ